MQDHELIALYFARDEQAIAQTDVKYGRYCRSIALRILQNLQDASQLYRMRQDLKTYLEGEGIVV